MKLTLNLPAQDRDLLLLCGPFKASSHADGHLSVDPEYRSAKRSVGYQECVKAGEDITPVGVLTRLSLAGFVEELLRAAYDAAFHESERRRIRKAKKGGEP